MSEWKKVKLGEIANIKTGKLDSNAAVTNGLYPFFTCDPTTLRINEWAYDTEAILLAGNNASGNYTAKYYKGKFNAYQRTYIIESKDCDSTSVRFLAYAMNLQLQLLKVMSSGSTTKFITMKMLTGLDIPQPSIEAQHRIATILSRYDTLIENYQKQIKLLEEAAQRFYKEWFVDLRFPGYENVKVVDGLPEGWEKGMLDDIAYESGKKVDKKKRELYDCYLPIDCLPKHSLTYLTPADITLAESSLVSFEENDIIFGAMRPYFHKVCFAQSNGLTRSTCFVLNSRQKEYREYLLMLMFDDNTVKHATSISVGTTMPYTRWKEFKTMVVLIPNTDIAKSFGLRISHITNRLRSLSSQIRLLTEARDRLLPRLVGGEIKMEK